MQQATILQFDLDSLRWAVGAGSYARGAEYARQRAVLHAAWDPDNDALRGMVRDDGRNVYQAAAFFSLAGRVSAGFKMGECSCPVRVNWLYAIERGDRPRIRVVR